MNPSARPSLRVRWSSRFQGLNYTDPDKRPRLMDINLQVRAGEIVGIAGVEGNGQLELVNVIMGLINPTSGSSKHRRGDHPKPILEKRRKVAFVSQDRANMGACVPAKITENAIMTHHRLNRRFTDGEGGFWMPEKPLASPRKCATSLMSR